MRLCLKTHYIIITQIVKHEVRFILMSRILISFYYATSCRFTGGLKLLNWFEVSIKIF